ncbi:helix-turn-helix transcriptional regulator [Shewanella zhangzhouensis]
MAAGYFPRSVKLGPRLVAWVENEIDEWIADKISNRDRNGD